MKIFIFVILLLSIVTNIFCEFGGAPPGEGTELNYPFFPYEQLPDNTVILEIDKAEGIMIVDIDGELYQVEIPVQ